MNRSAAAPKWAPPSFWRRTDLDGVEAFPEGEVGEEVGAHAGRRGGPALRTEDVCHPARVRADCGEESRRTDGQEVRCEDLGCEDLGCEDLGCEDLGCEDLGCEDLGCEDLGCE
ncbi:MAG: hypothetical protein IRZ16_18845, partial [Myxococcaceae bacterium]|nr:hypothetical protein [Myxococcaceae bacterium]